MSEELSLIIAIIGVIVSITTLISFVVGRKDKGHREGEEQGEMINDIKYIKQVQTNIAVDQKEILSKLDKTNERVTRVEEQLKSHERRIQKIEK